MPALKAAVIGALIWVLAGAIGMAVAAIGIAFGWPLWLTIVTGLVAGFLWGLGAQTALERLRNR